MKGYSEIIILVLNNNNDEIKSNDSDFAIDAWNQLCNFTLNNNNNNNIILRQDRIQYGIQPIASEKEIYLMKCAINENSDYDILSEHNNKVYLTQCLSFAHSNNNIFQNEMKKIFATHDKCKYMPAPVKTAIMGVLMKERKVENRPASDSKKAPSPMSIIGIKMGNKSNNTEFRLSGSFLLSISVVLEISTTQHFHSVGIVHFCKVDVLPTCSRSQIFQVGVICGQI